MTRLENPVLRVRKGRKENRVRLVLQVLKGVLAFLVGTAVMAVLVTLALLGAVVLMGVMVLLVLVAAA